MRKFLTVLFIGLFFLTACSYLDQAMNILNPTAEKDKWESEKADSDALDGYDLPADDKKAGDTNLGKHGLVEADETINNGETTGFFYYDRLSSEDRVIYDEILTALQNYEKDAAVSTLDVDTLERVFQCVMNDHPEIFYIQGYMYSKYMAGDELKKLTFSGTETITKEERDRRQPIIERYADEILNNLQDDMDQYAKVKYIYEYIILNTEYDAHVADNQNICSVILSHRSVCQGYAKTMQYLLQRAGIEATLVLGTVMGGNSHSWNLVKADDEYYYVDVTWGDASYQTANEDSALSDYHPDINYDYLCVTTDQICKTHTISSSVKLPVCVSVKDNYFYREGALFTCFDTEQLKQLFDEGYANESAYVTLKCTEKEVYDELYEYLIERQNVFTYLETSEGSVKYTHDDKQWSMSFWL